MRLIALTTSSPRSMVVLAEDRTVVASAQRIDPRGHSSFLVPALDFCFGQAGWNRAEVDAVVVDIGPGLYTGMRVGLATAQGLAAAVGATLLPVVSLDALAIRAATGHRLITAVTDVRRGEIAVAQYRPVPGGVVRESAPRLVNVEGLVGVLEVSENNLLVGNLDPIPPHILRGVHRVKTGRPRFPDGGAMVEIALNIWNKDRPPHPEEIHPLYMREPDININWAQIRPGGPWGKQWK